jgi:DnaJ-domain-containing protein 1
MPSASAVASSADGVPTSGDLSQLSPFQLYYLLASQAVNGKLSLTSGETTYDIWLKKGVPQQARSSSPGDSVLNTLGERGLLSAEQAVKAEAAAPQFGNDPIGAAFALGLIKDPNSVLAALTAHGQGLLQKALSLKEGTFAYDATAPQPGSPLPLGQKWPLLLAAGRALSGDEARRRLGDRMHMPVMKSTGRLALEDLGLNAQESRITASIEGVRSPAQLAENADPDLVARICYLLGELELASFAAVFVSGPAVEKPKAAPPVVGPAAAPPSASAAKPAAAAPGAGLRPPPTVNRPAASAPTASAPVAKPATVSASAAPKPATASAPRTTPAAAPAPTPAPVQDEKTLQALLEKQQNQDHFAVLGLKRDAAGPQIKIAYLNAVKVYHPDTAANAEPGVRELKEQIFARINEANNVLSDDASRANYLAELDAGGDEKVDVEAIFRAEEIFTKACIVVKARKYQEALKMLDEAIELNDNEAEFYAWRGWAAFMIVPDRKSALANGLTEMQKALKMSPRCAPAAFFAGQMLKLVGDNDNALVWFKKALDYDPQHLEAQSEIRALTRR